MLVDTVELGTGLPKELELLLVEAGRSVDVVKDVVIPLDPTVTVELVGVTVAEVRLLVVDSVVVEPLSLVVVSASFTDWSPVVLRVELVDAEVLVTDALVADVTNGVVEPVLECNVEGTKDVGEIMLPPTVLAADEVVVGAC